MSMEKELNMDVDLDKAKLDGKEHKFNLGKGRQASVIIGVKKPEEE